jgi:hypothetical protein
MNMTTKNQIFERYLAEYLKVSRERKGEILDHVVDVVETHRKAAIRKFRALQLKDRARQDRRGKETFYTPDVTSALKDVWEAGNEACGEILHPIINEYIDILIRDDMWEHNEETTFKLRKMSESTVKRRVAHFEQIRRPRGISTTKPSHLKSIIPIFKGPWNNLPPGHGQLDTVVHCGDSLQGDMAYTVNYIDAATYWMVMRAQWNKGQEATTQSMQKIQEHLPFNLFELHPDTGSEFINWVAKSWCDEQKIKLTRSEPGKKNDNMYVEERNGHVVRRYLGYIRVDDPDVVALVNEFYDVLAVYLNHFMPVRRTLSKERIGAKYRRTFEKRARTPYMRVLEHPDVSQEVKDGLKKEHSELNPLILKKKIDMLRNKIFDFKNRDRGKKP